MACPKNHREGQRPLGSPVSRPPTDPSLLECRACREHNRKRKLEMSRSRARSHLQVWMSEGILIRTDSMRTKIYSIPYGEESRAFRGSELGVFRRRISPHHADCKKDHLDKALEITPFGRAKRLTSIQVVYKSSEQSYKRLHITTYQGIQAIRDIRRSPKFGR